LNNNTGAINNQNSGITLAASSS